MSGGAAFSRNVSRGTLVFCVAVVSVILAILAIFGLGGAPAFAQSHSDGPPGFARGNSMSVAGQPSFINHVSTPVQPSHSDLPPVAIRIVPGSTINLVARSSKLPISIRNDYPVEIRVQVHVAPTNLDALVPAAIEVTVPANTTYVAKVPVTAITDGNVTLKAWLTTFSGIQLGQEVEIMLTVNAEVEDSLLTGFGIIVAGLAIAGIIRTRSKRRKTLASTKPN